MSRHQFDQQLNCEIIYLKFSMYYVRSMINIDNWMKYFSGVEFRNYNEQLIYPHQRLMKDNDEETQVIFNKR